MISREKAISRFNKGWGDRLPPWESKGAMGYFGPYDTCPVPGCGLEKPAPFRGCSRECIDTVDGGTRYANIADRMDCGCWFFCTHYWHVVADEGVCPCCEEGQKTDGVLRDKALLACEAAVNALEEYYRLKRADVDALLNDPALISEPLDLTEQHAAWTEAMRLHKAAVTELAVEVSRPERKR